MAAFPRLIWTFWHDPELPLTVKACLQICRALHPQWQLTVLNKDNYHRYTSNMYLEYLRHNDSLARFADFVRLVVLARYGGVWMDASIICRTSYEWCMHCSNPQTSNSLDITCVGFPGDCPTRPSLKAGGSPAGRGASL